MKLSQALRVANDMLANGAASPEELQRWLHRWLEDPVSEFEEFVARMRDPTQVPPTEVHSSKAPSMTETSTGIFVGQIPEAWVPEEGMPTTHHDSGSEQGATIALDPSQRESSLRFAIRQEVAKGGLGVVFIAKDRQLNRDVALKRIRDDRRDSELLREKFLLEAEVTGQLEHPGVVPVYALGIQPDGVPFYAMKLIRGKELKECIRAFHAGYGASRIDWGCLEFRQLLKRFVDVCNTIEYAHSRHILHRDLKPSNVMLGAHGETLVVDWGLAKTIDAPLNHAVAEESTIEPIDAQRHDPLRLRGSRDRSATQYGSFSGTAAYAPPEQLLGQLDRISSKSDIFSLGAVLFEIIANRPPVPSSVRSIGEVIDILRDGNALDPRSTVPSTPRPLAMICIKAMRFDPEDRYESASLLAEDIERWMADDRVLALGNQEHWHETLARCLRRYRSWTLPIAGAILFSAIVLAAGTYLVNQARLAEQSAKFRERQNKNDALERTAIARDAIDTLLTESSQSLADFPATRDLQQRLLSAAVSDYARLSRGDSSDPAIRLERVRAMVRVADIEAMQGNVETADSNYAEAILFIEDALEGVSSSDRDRIAWEIELGKTIARRALAWDIQSRTDEARREFERAQRLLERTLEASPDSQRARFVLARTQSQFADLLSRTDNAGSAVELLQKSLQSFERVEVASEPRVAIERRNARESLARCYRMLGQTVAATQQLLQLIDEVKAEEASPSTKLARPRDAWETTSRCYVALANTYREIGQYPEALACIENAQRGYSELRRHWPDSLLYIENEAATWIDLGLLHLDRKRPRTALEPLAKARALLEPMSESYPTISRYRYLLAITLDGLGQAAYSLEHDPQVAIEYLSKSRSLLEDHIRQTSDTDAIELFAALHSHQAQALDRVPSHDQSEQAFLDSITIYEQLVEHRPNEPRILFAMAIASWHYGEFLQRRGQLESALRHQRSAADRMVELHGRFPDASNYGIRAAEYLTRQDLLTARVQSSESSSIEPLVDNVVTRWPEDWATAGLQVWQDARGQRWESAQERLLRWREPLLQEAPFDRSIAMWIEELEHACTSSSSSSDSAESPSK